MKRKKAITNNDWIDYLRYLITLCTGAIVISAWYEQWTLAAMATGIAVTARFMLAEISRTTRQTLSRQRAHAELKWRNERAEMERAHTALLQAQTQRMQAQADALALQRQQAG